MSDSKKSAEVVCSRCGQSVEGMVAMTFVAMPENAAIRVCARCAAEDHATTITSVEEADQFIEETEGMLASLERIIGSCPEMPTIPEGLQGAMTPLTVYRTMQLHLAAFKSRRMELLTGAGSKAMADYEIKKAVMAEDYELALKLKRRQESQGR